MLPIFNTFSVNSQNNNKQNELCKHIICFFLVRRKISSLFFRLENLTISHIIAHWAVKFWAISIYLLSMEIYWHRLSHGCKICCILSLTNAQESFKLVLILPIDITYIDIAQYLTTQWGKNVSYRQFSRAWRKASKFLRLTRKACNMFTELIIFYSKWVYFKTTIVLEYVWINSIQKLAKRKGFWLFTEKVWKIGKIRG